jgi:hypothetical protein
MATEEFNANEHKRRVTEKSDGTFAYRCTCGDWDSGYLTRDYAIDGWRESHGMDPLINYPQV